MKVKNIKGATGNNMTKYILVLISSGSKKEAGKISSVLVEKRLAACAKVLGPGQSFYNWKGKMETKKEWVIMAKSTKRVFREIEKIIKELHSYETPEILAVSISGGYREYLKWIEESVL